MTTNPPRTRSSILSRLLTLSHELGREERQMAILGEGNTSARVSNDTFLVKASGSVLQTLKASDVVECKARPLITLLNAKNAPDQIIEKALLASRVNTRSRKPSVESLFHAYLLSLPGICYVAHAHPVAAGQVLCSSRASEFAVKRLFPDEIVCCGEASVFVPYTDPGFRLARELRRRAQLFIRRYRAIPRVVLMENHGVITMGPTPESALSAMLMAEKAARIWIGAAAIGGPTFLSKKHVRRIAGRLDEHYRQRALNL